MPQPTVPYIHWDAANLTRHFQKRTTEDTGCFEDLMGIASVPMTEAQYRQRSLDTVAGAWAEFEAEGRDVEAAVYTEARAYFVDDDLICSITDIERRHFVTCFHDNHPSGKHFDSRYHDNDKSNVAIGNRRLKFNQTIVHRVQGKLIRKYKSIRGVPNV